MLYIFSVTVPGTDYSPEQYAQAWIRVSEFIQARPGARGTRLHRDLNDPRRLLAIARWDSKASRDAMETNPPAEIEAIIATQSPHVDIEFIGEFSEADWVVLPPEPEEEQP